MLAVALLAGSPGAAVAAADAPLSPDEKIAPWLLDRLAASGTDSFLVLFDGPGSFRAAIQAAPRGDRPAKAVYDLLRVRSRSSQAAVRDWLGAKGIPFRPLYIVNGLEVSGSLELARAIAARSEVARIVGNPKVRGIEGSDPVMLVSCGLPYGVLAIRANAVWNQDAARGEGIVVASADTGVQWDHSALVGAYRGWSAGSASHDYNWHDAISDLAAPFDDNGHGTHTTGTMVGDNGAGELIGVAPHARWIACRNMDHGAGSPSTYLDCNQFFLAPYPHGGDPETDGDPSRAPDVINNSWGCPPSEGCDPLVLEDSFAALEAAGILPVASAGNSGPSCSTVSDPPSIYGESLVAGATNSTRTLASFSSRGPVIADGSNRLRPDVVAPGVGVCSAYPPNAYVSLNGTSMASPHTAGATALLWSARPQLKNLIGITRCTLSRSANPAVTLSSPQTCGGTPATTLPNNMFGWGQVDAYAAVHFGPDADADGIADPCDCAPADSGAYDAPREVAHLDVMNAATVSWDSLSREAGAGTVYDLVRGTLQDLLAAGGIAGAACVAAEYSATAFSETLSPAPGEGFYYVVRGRNACGTGTWGAASTGEPRTHPGCP